MSSRTLPGQAVLASCAQRSGAPRARRRDPAPRAAARRAAGCRRRDRAAAAGESPRPPAGSRGPAGMLRGDDRARRSRLVAAMMRTSTGDRRVPPTPADRSAVSSTRRSFGCSSSGSSPISSRNSVPPSARSNAPVRSACAPVNAPLLVTEQLALDQVRRHRAAVDDDERAPRARARAVDRVGDDVLAGAGLADQGDRHVAGREALRRRPGPRPSPASARRHDRTLRTIGVPWRDEPGVSKLSAGKAVSSTGWEIILRVDGSSSMHPSIAAATRVDV